MVSAIKNLKKKYATTYKDIEEAKLVTSSALIEMIGDLKGSSYDMAGLEEFKKFMEE